MKFRKKPVIIEAIQWDGGNTEQIDAFIRETQGSLRGGGLADDKSYYVIATLEGAMTASVGDWIIRGVKREYYACKPDIFDATYEAVT